MDTGTRVRVIEGVTLRGVGEPAFIGGLRGTVTVNFGLAPIVGVSFDEDQDLDPRMVEQASEEASKFLHPAQQPWWVDIDDLELLEESA